MLTHLGLPGVIAFAVHREGDDPRIRLKEGSRAVALVHVQVDDEHGRRSRAIPGSSARDEVSASTGCVQRQYLAYARIKSSCRCDAHVVEHAETLSAVAKRVVRACAKDVSQA